MMDAALAETLGRQWAYGWNAEDVDVIMAPFADDVVFTSPFVARVTGGTTTIAGDDALRSYVADALARSPGIRYTLDESFVGTESVVLVYTCRYPDGRPDKRGADSMRVDPSGRVVEWRCHY